MYSESVFDANLETPRLARHYVRETLDSWDCSTYSNDAELVISELATNAMSYDGPTMTVSLTLDSECLVLAVCDANRTHPSLCAFPDDAAESGRGLGIVAALSNSWGTSTTSSGKEVWARIDR